MLMNVHEGVYFSFVKDAMPTALFITFPGLIKGDWSY